jgi:hypothetical protein
METKNISKIFLIIVSAVLFLFPNFIFAATIYSNYSTGNDTTGDGTSGNPYKTFTKAYAMSSANDTIDLTGTFDWSNADETGESSGSTGFTIAKALTIQGHGADQTIIQAASTPNTAGKRVFYATSALVLKNLTVRYAYENIAGFSGSAIYAGHLTLINCWIDQNKNHGDRYVNGAIFSSGNLIIRNSTISNNENGYVGGIYAHGTIEVTNSTFYNNYGEYYGALFVSNASGPTTVTNSTFLKNKADVVCADVCPWYSTLYIKNTIMAQKVGYNPNFDKGNSTIYDGGYNIVETQASPTVFTNGVNGNLVGVQANLNIDTSLATNSTSNGVPTLALQSGSVAINAGDPNNASQNSINVPVADQRYFYRSGNTDIGAFEYEGSSSYSRPTVQASLATFSSVAYNQMTVGWTNGNGMRRVVFMKAANTGTATPVDATTYTASTVFGSGTQIGTSGWYTVFNGSGTSVTVTGLTRTTDYIVQIFEYSGVSGSELYFTDTATDNPKTQATTAVPQPTTQAYNITSSSVAYTTMTVGWTNGNGTKRVVFAKQANTGTATPVDDTTYTASTTFGSGTQIGTSGWYCIYNGTGTSVNISGLTAQTDYIFQVFEYNGTAGLENYFTDTATDNPKVQASLTVSEPTTQATNLTFSSIAYTTMTVGWTNGNGGARIVFAKQANTGTATPVDDTNYTASATFGSGTQIGSTGWYAIYKGTGTSVSISNLVAGTDYIFQVFEYNNSGAIYNYNTAEGTNNPKYQMSLAVVAPTTQAHSVTFSSVAYNQMTVGWTNGNSGTSTRIVFAKQADTGTATPVNNTNYTASATFGSGTQIETSGWYAVYKGSGTSVVVTGLLPSTNYIFQVFEYNYNGVVYSYNTNTANNNPLAQATTAVLEPTTQAYSISFSSVAGSQFTISWTNGNGAKRAVFIKAASSGTATPVDNTTYTANTAFGSGTQIASSGWYCVYNSTSTSVTVTGLSSSTTYIAQVFEYNGSAGSENYFTDTATDNPKTQATTNEVQIGTGTGTQYYLPWSTYYRYSYSQMIYTSAEIGSGSTIQSIKFKYNGNTTYTWNSLVVYMGHTTKSEFASATDWVSVGSLTQVYSGSVAVTAGAAAWYTITLSTPFQYNGTDNLLIAIDNNQNGYTSSSSQWYYTTSTNKYIYAQSDSTNYSPSSPPSGTRNSDRPNIVLGLYNAPQTYTLTYTAGANGTISGSSPQTVSSGANGSQVTAVADSGYHFTSWSDGILTAARTDTNVQANVSVTASFEADAPSYTLTYLAGAHGSITGSTPQTVVSGANGSAVTAVADSGYVFSSWSDSSTANPRTDTNVQANVSVTASFVIDNSLIYVNSSTGNDATGDGSSGAPYKTFYKGYTSVSSGGTIDLTGIFTWTDSAEVGDAAINGYIISKNITLSGHGADTTVLQAESYDNKADRRVLTINPAVTATIQNLAIRYGKATSSSSDGGGILNKGILTITNCEIYNNRAPGSYGGGISNWNKLTVNNSTIYNNMANYMGGGIVNSYYVAANGFLNITNSTIAYNQLTAVTAYTDGGGVHYRKGSGTITNSTIAYNTACGTGGLSMDDATGIVTVKNTILANNRQINHSYCNNGLAPRDFGYRTAGMGNVVDGGYNIIGYSNNYNWVNSTDWIGAATWAALVNNIWDKSTYTLRGTSETGSLNLEGSLALNNNSSKTQTLALLTNSIAINNGGTGTNGLINVPSTDQRGNSRTGATDIGAFEYGGAPTDTTPPVISNVSATATNSTATITWSTDEESSSQVKYDPQTYLTTRTPVTDVSVKTIGHEVTLSNLVACSKYYYSVISQDDAGNIATSSAESFYTTGCAGSQTISSVSELVFTPASTNGAEVDTATTTAADSDYQLSHSAGNLTFGLAIPRTFSENTASLQVKSLSATTALNALNKPTNYNAVGSSVFDIKALTDPTSTVSSFDSSATVTLTYTDSDITGIDESTLVIYRNDGSDWSALSNCTVNTTAKTVTCSTTNFSVFGLFGQSTSVSSGGAVTYFITSSAGVGGSIKPSGSTTVSSIGSQLYSITPNAGFKIADVLVDGKSVGSVPTYLFNNLNANHTISATFSASVGADPEYLEKEIQRLQALVQELLAQQNTTEKYIFKRNLYLGISGEDAKELQKYLNDHGFVLSETGDGSPGNETTTFGLLTKKALIKFQKANNIEPAWGFFGPITRELVNSSQ